MAGFAETLRELLGELRQQRTRTLLSLLSLTWGTAAILLLMAFSIGFEALFQERTRGMGDGVAVSWPARTTLPWLGFPRGRAVRIAREDVLALPAAVPGLEAASAEFRTSERLRRGGTVLRVNLAGVDPDYGRLRKLDPAPGSRFVSPADLAERRRVIFLGDVLAGRLFGAEDPVGKTLVLRGAPFTVIGVMQKKEQDSDYGGKDEDQAFVPGTTFQALFGARQVNDFVFRARDPGRQAECSAAVTRALAARLRFDPADRGALNVWDTTEQIRMLGWIFLGFHVILGLSGAFTLLVGAVGIANLMFLLVRRRTAEFGLKLAVGARPQQIRREVLLQSLVLVATGGGLGALLAVGVTAAIAASPLVAETGTPVIPGLLAAVTVSLLAGVGLLAGWYPARAAARLDPVLALRS
jgi:putative ABC transport system permease protein